MICSPMGSTNSSYTRDSLCSGSNRSRACCGASAGIRVGRTDVFKNPQLMGFLTGNDSSCAALGRTTIFKINDNNWGREPDFQPILRQTSDWLFLRQISSGRVRSDIKYVKMATLAPNEKHQSAMLPQWRISRGEMGPWNSFSAALRQHKWL